MSLSLVVSSLSLRSFHPSNAVVCTLIVLFALLFFCRHLSPPYIDLLCCIQGRHCSGREDCNVVRPPRVLGVPSRCVRLASSEGGVDHAASHRRGTTWQRTCVSDPLPALVARKTKPGFRKPVCMSPKGVPYAYSRRDEKFKMGD